MEKEVMKITKDMVATVTYELYVDAPKEGEPEELMEVANEKRPLTYCQGRGMMLPKFEAAMEGLQEGDSFDFRIPCADAYGEYDTDGVITLDKKMFYNGDGEFDSERVFVGAVVPMNTSTGQVVNAQIVEITDDKVTIDLNHPLAGENLHFVGKVVTVRPITPGEVKAFEHQCGKCHGHCHEGGCGEGGCHEGGCGEGGCENGDCQGGCGNCK